MTAKEGDENHADVDETNDEWREESRLLILMMTMMELMMMIMMFHSILSISFDQKELNLKKFLFVGRELQLVVEGMQFEGC